MITENDSSIGLRDQITPLFKSIHPLNQSPNPVDFVDCFAVRQEGFASLAV